MTSTSDQLLALHGFSLRVPADWDLAVNAGEWRRGVLVLAADREARLSLSWERSRRKPDWDRSITTLATRAGREHQARVVQVEPRADGGRFVKLRADDGDRHAVLFQPDPQQGLLVVLRQLAPGGSDVLRELASATRAHPTDAPLPWSLHGLRCTLPPTWRLVGVHNLLGLQRAVWFRTLREGRRPDALLVLRRYACASQQLGEGSIGAWLRSRLGPGETIVTDNENDLGYQGISDGPGSTWWRRFRKIRERRHLYAWREPELDRLILQEFKGAAPELPCLRQTE